MSELPQEATQAAVDWDKARNKDVDGFPTIIEAFAYGHDTATAKAQEELEEVKAYKDRFWEAMKRINELKRQLAHQPLDSARDKQPSACPKCGYKSCLDLSSPSLQQPVKAQQPSAITTNEQAYRDGTLSQSN